VQAWKIWVELYCDLRCMRTLPVGSRNESGEKVMYGTVGECLGRTDVDYGPLIGSVTREKECGTKV
jgi:hypothetical protein